MVVQLPDPTVASAISPESSAAAEELGPSRWHLLRAKLDVAGPTTVLILIILACFVWPEIYRIPNPIEGNLTLINARPFVAHHLLGTDPFGNDVLSRLLYGGRVSLEVGLGSTGIGLVLGSILGTTAGYKGGFVESLIMRLLDVLLAFPTLILVVTIATYLGPSEIHVIWAISFFSIPAFARLSRASTLRLRQQDFIAAARLSGSSDWRILSRHVMPNVVPQLLTFALLGVSVAIVVEATLSFLGLGVPPPGPSWGNMIALGQTYLGSDTYLVLIPSAALFVTILNVNLLGDALRHRLGLR